MLEKAYAKMNLSLNIVEKRLDGYHSIETIILPLDLHDSIEIDLVKNRKDDDFIVCDDYNVGISKYNLCHKAINVARQHWGFKDHFDVSIHKNIFLQSGLGGGSADAAAVLRCVVKLLNIKSNKAEMIEVAKLVGADVPFMLFNKPSLVCGVGETLTPIKLHDIFREYFILLVKPIEGLSTTEVYTEFDKVEQKHFDIGEIQKALANGNEEILPSLIGNSLETSAFELLPKLKDLKKDLVSRGFELVFMTGGGSCMVAMTKNKKLAKKTLKEYYLDHSYDAEITNILKPKKRNKHASVR